MRAGVTQLVATGATALLGCALTACGSDSGGETPQEGVRSTLVEFRSAIVEGDGEAACAQLSPTLSHQLAEDALYCELYFGSSLPASERRTATAKIRDVSIHGAEATVKTAAGRIELRRADGNWLIVQF
jgi:hypothetical protein